MYSRLFRPVASAAMGAAGLYLAQETHKYQLLQSQMAEITSSQPAPVRKTVEAEKKEWFVIGRQSPHYVRDTEKTPKGDLLHQISQSPLRFKGLGTRLDNEKHYDLLPGSEFIAEPFTSDESAPRVLIKPTQMIGEELSQIQDSDWFEVSIARKQAFADLTQQSPFFHSSLALRRVNPESAKSSAAVVINGREAKALIDDINETICEPQHCTLFDSNCYSATVYGTAKLIGVLDQRPHADTKKSDRDIESVAKGLALVAGNNLGRGVTNNSVVWTQLMSEVPKIMKKRDLLPESKVSSEHRLQ